MYNKFGIKKEIVEYVNNIEKSLYSDFVSVDRIYEYNQLKVLNAFIENKVSETDFIESTGYGYNDIGRDKIEKIYSDIFHTEDALVRMQIVSGTHALSLALFALTLPNDNILSINGLPYDTLLPTIGTNNELCSLREYNVNFDSVDLLDGKFDLDSIEKKINSNTKIIMIQRSRGYSTRNAFSVEDIKNVIFFVKSIKKDVLVFVDNCYGEFVDVLEPTNVGADIVCGSLIKNIGGSLAKSGGYICGKKNLIERCAYRLTAPGIGKEVGINFNQNRNILQGLYFAPQIVANALKTVILYRKVFNSFSLNTVPSPNDDINDIVIAIYLNNEKNINVLCNAIQSTSPIDSFVKPISNEMPGYDDKVIMAAGNFIQGSSIELSCDGPIRQPYIAYLQGGISYYQSKLALMKTIMDMELI